MSAWIFVNVFVEQMEMCFVSQATLFQNHYSYDF